MNDLRTAGLYRQVQLTDTSQGQWQKSVQIFFIKTKQPRLLYVPFNMFILAFF
jgi:hypothetical protein